MKESSLLMVSQSQLCSVHTGYSFQADGGQRWQHRHHRWPAGVLRMKGAAHSFNLGEVVVISCGFFLLRVLLHTREWFSSSVKRSQLLKMNPQYPTRGTLHLRGHTPEPHWTIYLRTLSLNIKQTVVYSHDQKLWFWLFTHFTAIKSPSNAKKCVKSQYHPPSKM